MCFSTKTIQNSIRTLNLQWQDSWACWSVPLLNPWEYPWLSGLLIMLSMNINMWADLNWSCHYYDPGVTLRDVYTKVPIQLAPLVLLLVLPFLTLSNYPFSHPSLSCLSKENYYPPPFLISKTKSSFYAQQEN